MTRGSNDKINSDSFDEIHSGLITTIQEIILLAAKGNRTGYELNRVIALLNHRHFSQNTLAAVFNESFAAEVLAQSCALVIPTILKLIGKALGEPRAFLEKNHLLVKLLADDIDPGVRTAALATVRRNADLFELTGVRGRIVALMRHSDFWTAELATRIVGESLLDRDGSKEAILRRAFDFSGPACLTALNIIERNFFAFDFPPDLLSALSADLQRLRPSPRIRNDDEIVYVAADQIEELLGIARLYTILLQAGAMPPKWPDVNPVLRSLLGIAAQFHPNSRRGRQIRRALMSALSAYRIALHEFESELDEKFKLPLSIILKESKTNPVYQRRDETLRIQVGWLGVAFLGLNSTRVPPRELNSVFQALHAKVAKVLNEQVFSQPERLSDLIGSVRIEVKQLAESIPNDVTVHGSQSDDSELTSSVMKYSQDPSRANYNRAVSAVEFILADDSDDAEIQKILWNAGRNYLRDYLARHKRWWFDTTRNILHNLDNQAESSLSPRLLASKFLLLPLTVNALISDRPDNIQLSTYLDNWKKDMEKAYERPGCITIRRTESSSEEELFVWLDPRRLHSVLENCVSNALQSIEEYNNETGDSGNTRLAQIDVQIRGANDGVHILFDDNGHGLRGDRREWQGSGHAIIRRYIEEAGGTVEWKNKNEYRKLDGARVVISLPRRAE